MIISTCNEKPIQISQKKITKQIVQATLKLWTINCCNIAMDAYGHQSLRKTVSENNASKMINDFSVTFVNLSQNSLSAIPKVLNIHSTPRHQRNQFKVGHQQIYCSNTAGIFAVMDVRKKVSAYLDSETLGSRKCNRESNLSFGTLTRLLNRYQTGSLK